MLARQIKTNVSRVARSSCDISSNTDQNENSDSLLPPLSTKASVLLTFLFPALEQSMDCSYSFTQGPWFEDAVVREKPLTKALLSIFGLLLCYISHFLFRAYDDKITDSTSRVFTLFFPTGAKVNV